MYPTDTFFTSPALPREGISFERTTYNNKKIVFTTKTNKRFEGQVRNTCEEDWTKATRTGQDRPGQVLHS